MNNNAIEEIQVMKLDTSGFDWNIYTGGKEAFEDGRIKVLFFDLLKKQLLLHGTKSSKIINFLLDNKYTIFNSIGGTDKDSVRFNLHNHKKEFNLLNIQKVIKNEDCSNSFPHIHGLAIHDSFLKNNNNLEMNWGSDITIITTFDIGFFLAFAVCIIVLVVMNLKDLFLSQF